MNWHGWIGTGVTGLIDCITNFKDEKEEINLDLDRFLALFNA